MLPFVNLFLLSPHTCICGIIWLADYADTLKGILVHFGKYLDSACCFYDISNVYPMSIRILLFPKYIKRWHHNCMNFRGSIDAWESKHRIIWSVNTEIIFPLWRSFEFNIASRKMFQSSTNRWNYSKLDNLLICAVWGLSRQQWP